MTDKKMKTQRIILVSALSVFSIFMLVMIVARFNESTAAADDAVQEVTTIAAIERELVITTQPLTTTSPPTTTEAKAPETFSEEKDTDENEPEADKNETPNIIVQDFPEATKPEPPENPSNQISEDELTNPDVKPTYQPEQTTAAQTTTAPKSNEPYNGQKKDGKVYVEGFGWVVDEGGQAVVEYAEGMVENGNKIGYFG